MNTDLETLRESRTEVKSAILALKYELTFRKLMNWIEAKFDPEQPRDEQGRWTDGTGQPFDVAARGNEAACDAQYSRDKLICNLVKTPLCWAQAMERYAACLSGRQIPQLRF